MKKLWPKQNRAMKMEGAAKKNSQVAKIRNRVNFFFLRKLFSKNNLYIYIYIYIYIYQRKDFFF